mmetsp:Transcript_9234/g.17569  ORF Transcript_9234/g.17569 Transcript_9234/m.17569 type:complete len:138 (+) Transcript_9234:2103-2516(+)
MSFKELPSIWQSSNLMDSKLLLSRFREVKTAKAFPSRQRLLRVSPSVMSHSEPVLKQAKPRISRVSINLKLDNSFIKPKDTKPLQVTRKKPEEASDKFTTEISSFMKRFEARDSAPIKPNRRGLNGWKIVPKKSKRL